jgi:predicted RNase H-like nuclease (RuvC/YqgF family)
MKKLIYLFVVATMLLTSCVSKQVVLDTESQRDSLARVVRTKDSLIETVFADINAISDNLARIKARENIITAVDPEGIRRPIDQINSDIAAIDELMQENRERIAGMERTAQQLRKANVKIKSLEHLISDLNGQLDEKNNEISQLRTRVAEMSVEVEELETKLEEEIAVHRQEVDSLTQNNSNLDEQLHAVYYIVGQEKKLREAQIIDKRGFIGRTLKTAASNSLDFFLQVDSRELLEVPIRQKRVTLVTSHPEGSYQLIEADDKVVLKLVITDPVRFWESSKVLIVSYK